MIYRIFRYFSKCALRREDLVVDFQAITSQKNGGSKIFCHQFCHRQPALMLLFLRVAVTKIGKISNFANSSSFFHRRKKKSTCGAEKGRCSEHGSATLFCLRGDRIGVVCRPVSKVCFGLIVGRLVADSWIGCVAAVCLLSEVERWGNS